MRTPGQIEKEIEKVEVEMAQLGKPSMLDSIFHRSKYSKLDMRREQLYDELVEAEGPRRGLLK